MVRKNPLKKLFNKSKKLEQSGSSDESSSDPNTHQPPPKIEITPPASEEMPESKEANVIHPVTDEVVASAENGSEHDKQSIPAADEVDCGEVSKEASVENQIVHPGHNAQPVPACDSIKPEPSADVDCPKQAEENQQQPLETSKSRSRKKSDDSPVVVASYDAIPVLEITKLPRGGVSMETEAVGRVQFGIPPETIKDSMRLGLEVPTVYIVPVERFCREMGPALGVNLAEFEFPAYFNFFVQRKKCTLIVDSDDAEQNIRRVFSETLLGPAQFRRQENPIAFEEEDFCPEFPREAIPNFIKELKHFRTMPDGKELVLETLLKFLHFQSPGETTGVHENLGIPPPLQGEGYEEIVKALNLEERIADEAEEDREEDDINEELMSEEEALVPADITGVERCEKKLKWTYSHARFNGDVATVYPSGATPEQIAARTVKRVEIFKMPSGTEYIIHDIDEHNYIVGKARFQGHVRVSESMTVVGFGSGPSVDNIEEKQEAGDGDDGSAEETLRLYKGPPSFHPPSFGVTVLGNSHGFDKSGSVSGYVLWINGRGVMIDPPPYASATLEREGIRPRTIVGIILTHCHADHDAGAFQKVLTGSPVVVITTPTIYKSFIRKYAALSALSPALLRHCHRHKPAIIGTPLRFQGATFHFTYSLHTIPCVGFRVEWRGRSLVFTGDHFNNPEAIDKLQEEGVLSKARADDLRNLPLQETDLLLHEAGAPPIHTPLDVLLKLPQRVKKRLYVVHTSALPEGCELRAAPTGTAGTIRLDQMHKSLRGSRTRAGVESSIYVAKRGSLRDFSNNFEDETIYASAWSSEYENVSDDSMAPVSSGSDQLYSSFAHRAEPSYGKMSNRHSVASDRAPPLVSLRPSSSTDAWFVLNLLSAVPFLTSLSYASTMEVLETAKVDAFCMGDVIVQSSKRPHVLCVIWEGTCVERKNRGLRPSMTRSGPLLPIEESNPNGNEGEGAVWHAGDWTGPIALQPEKELSGESSLSSTHDVVAMSNEGVKVITIEFSSLHAILKSGSLLYRKYLERTSQQQKAIAEMHDGRAEIPNIPCIRTQKELVEGALDNLNVLDLLNCNSAFRKLTAVQKRHLESLAEGPVPFGPGERLWRAGAAVDKAFVVVAGTVSFLPRRRNAGSVSWRSRQHREPGTNRSLGESMRIDAIKAIKELGGVMPDAPEGSCVPSDKTQSRVADGKHIQLDKVFSRKESDDDEEEMPSSLTEAHDFAKLSRSLKKRADLVCKPKEKRDSMSSEGSSQYDIHDDDSHDDVDIVDLAVPTDDPNKKDDTRRSAAMKRRRSSKARLANKVLGRLYSRRAFTGGLVFSRGHFLGDVSKMVAGLLGSESDMHGDDFDDESSAPRYGFGEKSEGRHGHARAGSIDMVIHEQEGDEHIVHSSTLTAGKDGCLVLVFPRSSLIPFLDEYPGLLLSLLGTQVVV